MGASLNEEGIVAHRPQAEATDGPGRAQVNWPRFSANSAHHAGATNENSPRGLPGMRNWTAGELSGLLCDFLKREHAALAACHGQNVEADWIPLARALAIRLSEAPGMSIAASPLKSRFLLREQIGAWLVHTALDAKAASLVHVVLPDSWNGQKVLAYLFRHEIAPMHHVTAALRSNSMPLALSQSVQEDNVRASL